jgi:predicted ATPase
LQVKSGDQPRSSGDVAITLLGGFGAMAGGELIADSVWRLRKGRELVKLLALAEGHSLHREQLIDVLWPEREPDAAANNLNQVVHAARRALGAEAITLRDEMLTLHADAGVDVDDFERTAAHARRAGTSTAYRAALSLYGGELLPENRYDDWAGVRREELDQLREELEAELTASSCDDRLHVLPPQASSFVGREREIRELTASLKRTRLLTLAGAGGAGKTRLALELASEAESSYADGVALIELANVSEGQLVAGAAAAALDVGALPGRSPLDGIIDFLAPRTLLLVLDNCEHVLGASAALADALLRAAPDVSIVATSREPMRVAGEVVFRVPSLAIPDPNRELGPEELLRYEAVRLLAERAAAAAPGFAIDAENAVDIARICFRLDGLPLALELAAARLGALGTATLAERLDDRFRLLRAGSRTAPTRQQTLAATLQWSHDLLADDERLLLRRLAVFAGGFELTAAEAVCTGEGLEAGAVVDVLARLVEKSLVGAEEVGRERRYQLLETVRLYAAERLEDAGERASLVLRHAHWALDTVEREGDSPRLDREAANLRIAHDVLPAREALRYCVALSPFWLRRIDLEEAQRRFLGTLAAAAERDELRATALLAASAIDYRAGSLARGASHAQESYEIATELADSRAQWRAAQRLGEFAVGYDHADRAVGLFESARELARSDGLQAAEAISVYSLGVARWLLGDLEGAEDLLTDSATSFRALAGSGERIQSPLNIAEMRRGNRFGQPGLRIVFEETLKPFVEISCEAAVAYVLANQATIARLRGQPEHARELLDEAAARFSEASDERGQADVLVRRAYLEIAEEAPSAARECFESALRLRRQMGDRRGIGIALSGLGLVEIISGDHPRAEQLLSEARELFRRAGDRWGLVSSLWRTADLALARDRLEDAEAALEEARAVVGETEREGWIAVTLATLAEVARLRGEDVRAESLFGEAREHYLAAGDETSLTALDARVQSLAKDQQSQRKEGGGRTTRTENTKRRQR